MQKPIRLTKKHLYLFLTICALAIFCNAKTVGVSAYGYSFAFALIQNNYYGWIISLAYLVFSSLLNLKFSGLICSLASCATMIIYCLIVKTTKKQSMLTCLILCAFSRVANIYFSLVNVKTLLLAFLDLIIGLVFCLISCKLISAIKNRGLQCFTRAEKFYLSVVCTCLFCGLLGISAGINISKTLFIFIILSSSIILKNKTANIACFIAVAHILTGYSAFDGMTYFVLACVATWISPINKILSGCVVCLTDAIIGLFGQYNILLLVSTLLAALIFICIPKKIFQQANQYLFGGKTSLINSYYISKRQELIKTRLVDMGMLFKQIQKIYRDVLIKEGSFQQVSQIMAAEVKASLCENCSHKNMCEQQDVFVGLNELAGRAQSRGKVNILDASPILSSNCTNLQACLSLINQLSTEYKQKEKQVKLDDENKMNISTQMGETSQIFMQLSSQFSSSDKVNAKKSGQIKDFLLSSGVVCTECVAIENTNGVHEVLIIVRNSDTVSPCISKACTKYYNLNFECKHSFQTNIAGWSLMCLVPINRYDLVCGYATKSKQEGDLNGDNYVYSKLTDNKFLVAICDGMGHGKEANEVSALAISLIESYYKCGLSNQIITESVNNLLLPTGDQKFSTLDTCIIDTISGDVDFIKMGSTISVIKKENVSQLVDVQSLPLGISSNSRPTTFSQTLFDGDMIIMASDGIVDSFGHENFKDYINNERILNTQLFAESILEEAQARNREHKDDMTVIVCKLVQKRA